MIWWCALLTSVSAGLATSLMVPPVARLARRLGALDHPSARKLQQQPVPRLGGVAVLFGIAIGLGLGMALTKGQGALSTDHLLRFIGATLAIFILGAIDDLRGVSVAWKLLVQGLAAWVVIGIGWQIETVRVPLAGQVDLGMLAPLISLVWIIGVTNAINLLDGLDGLAGGVVAIVSVSLMGYSVLHGHINMVVFTCAMAGASLGFLRHNWEPAQIYLGDSGSLTLGFMLASFALQFSVKASATVTILVPILALGLPLIDTLLVMAFRFTGRGSGGSFLERCAGVFRADRHHLHHRALALGAKRSQIVLGLHGVVTAFCLMAVVVAIRDDIWLGLGLLVIEVAAVLSIRIAGLRAQTRKMAQAQREEAREIIRTDLKQKQEPQGPEIGLTC